MTIDLLVDFATLALLVVIAVAVVRLRDLFAVSMLFGIYSLLSAALFVILDAADVAFTEAAVGAGVSTVLLLATLTLVDRKEALPKRSRTRSTWLPLAVVTITGAGLIYGTLDMPEFGDPGAPAEHVSPRYINESPKEIGIPNMVTSVLASYRGYDTLGEVAVVFTAGVGVMALLGFWRRRSEEDEGA